MGRDFPFGCILHFAEISLSRMLAGGNLIAGVAFDLKMGDLAMDSELRTRISGIVNQLAEQEQQRLRTAGTFVELEELACEIGDEVTRQLMGGHLAERCEEAADSPSAPCPDCEAACSRAESQPRKLDSSRGCVEYAEPAFHCPSCRRSFFPGSRLDGSAIASDRYAEVGPADGLGGK
jgi:hypothetical protein